MTRSLYGVTAGEVVAAPTPSTTDDPTTLGIAAGAVLTIWSFDRSRQYTDLLKANLSDPSLQGGLVPQPVPITQVTSDTLGRAAFWCEDGVNGPVWAFDGANWWLFNPADIASRFDGYYTKAEVNALLATLGGNPDVPPTVTFTTSAITSNTATLSWTIDPGTYSVDGTFQGRDPVGALPAFESTTMTPGLTGSRTYTNLPSGSTVTLYVKLVVDGVTGPRVDQTVTTTTASSAPANTALPVISGLAQVGQTLTVSNGTWTGGPTGYSYQWLANGAPISGATTNSRTLQSDKVGQVISCTVTATNAVGSTAATSAETAAVTPAPVSPPTNTAVPTITGTPKMGVALSSSPGTWTNSPSYARQWQTMNVGTSTWVDLAGATSASYTPVSSDVGDTLRLKVVGTNAAGSATAYSAATGAVASSGGGGGGGYSDFTIPSGKTLYYGRDFTVASSSDDANWATQTGTASNEAAIYQAANVVKNGPNGQELIANRASDTATIYSGAVRNYSLALPQYFYMRYVFKLMNFAHGSWPSMWSRPSPNFPGTVSPNEGELDFMEAFGAHIGSTIYNRLIGSTIILTPYATKTLVQGPDFGMDPNTYYGSPGTYGAVMTLEINKQPNSMTATVNGSLRSTMSRTSSNATKWDAQMEDTDKKWYVRLDHQAGNATNSQAGDPDPGWRESRQSMLQLVIGV